MISKRRTDVLVVGAGPVGLFSAVSLAHRGIKVRILDKGWRPSVHSYALALHSKTLRLLDEFGLADELIERGHRIDTIAWYQGEERVGELTLSALGGSYPFLLVLPQSELENALERHLRETKAKVWWNHQLMAARVEPEAVTADTARMDKVSLGYPVARTEWVITKKSQMRASFLVGADGYHSLVRRILGIRYENLGGIQLFAVFEFPSPMDLGREMRVVFHDGLLNVLWPMKDGRARWSFQITTEGPQPGASVESLGKFLSTRAPWFRPLPDELYWATTTQFERRLVDRFGRDRAFLVGDAAHLTGPVGVQSMNVGLAEARDLANGIAEILGGAAGAERLEAFEAERRAEWRMLLGLGDEARVRDDAPEWARQHASRLIGCMPASGEDLATLLGRFGIVPGPPAGSSTA